MTREDDLAEDYEQQAKIIWAKINGLKPLTMLYKGADLHNLNRKIAIYISIARECEHIAGLLREMKSDEVN